MWCLHRGFLRQPAHKQHLFTNMPSLYSVKRNCVFAYCLQDMQEHFVLHVGCIIRIYGTDFINGYNLASLYKRVGVVSVEVEQYIGFCAGFKVGNNTGLKGFICAS